MDNTNPGWDRDPVGPEADQVDQTDRPDQPDKPAETPAGTVDRPMERRGSGDTAQRPRHWDVAPSAAVSRPPSDRRALYGYSVEPATPPPPPPNPPRRFAGLGAVVLAGAVGSLITSGLIGLMGGFRSTDEPAPSSTTLAAVPATVVEIREFVTDGDESSIAKAVAEKVVPSIVTVEIGTNDSNGDFAAFGSGSGVVLTRDGLIATNHHVIVDSDVTRVIFQNGRIYDAEIVGSDSLTDLAVLRIDAVDLIPVTLGATKGLAIGDRAIAIGNPLGLRGGASLTVGVVSAFDREVQVSLSEAPLVGMLQTDAPITQGSSGGALVDRQGRLIGITSAIGVSSAGAEGIGFAIPVELVERITNEIIDLGEVRHAFLGVSLADSFATLDDGSIMPDGALITDFAGTGLAAEQGGLQRGDIVVGYDGVAVETRDDLIIGIRQYRVGDTLVLEVERGGETVTVEVVLGERPENL